MRMPDVILAKTLARFDSLISEGNNILAAAQDVPATMRRNSLSGELYQTASASKAIDAQRFIEWRTKAATLLAFVVPKNHIHYPCADELTKLHAKYALLQTAVSVLRGVRDDLDKGFLDDLSGRLEAEVACDYMGQAQQLLAEGHAGRFDHVPAAVLAGAVLERALRRLCNEQQPPVELKTSKGEFKTMGPIIDDLKKVGVFNEAKAKQLRAWADIRNLAAHGEFQQFKRSDVDAMVAGISTFLADYLK